MRYTRKGALEIQYVILLIIAVVVLLVILYIYRNQFSLFTNTIFGITDDINSSIPPVNTILG